MTLPVTRFEGLVYRAHHPGWAFDPESGEGARMHGGRFNRPSTACFYTSLRLETAWLEAQQGFAFKAQPMTLCSYRIDCSDILDLTTDEGLAAALVTRAELACAWEVMAADRKPVPTWELADRLIEAGCAGIIVPSFAARAGERDINLVLWRWTRDKPHMVTVVDDDNRLPKDRSSWQ
ncbi:RES family NAD+ phosphorylase [Erythrobacter colymbi]|uniref:RES family NAD+ phosphorylase n=1 Tax=Erythrobacter colymbi TaxID=1161202 RepID=UPI000A3CE9EA|nr:RES domain-containing protein [Erythrobacter colymbi]